MSATPPLFDDAPASTPGPEAGPPVPLTGPLGALRRLDWWLLGSVVILAAFGLMMILSASNLAADARYGNGLHFVGRQALGLSAAAVALLAIVFVPYGWLRKLAWPTYLAGLVGLCLVFTPLGYQAYGAVRWISLGGLNIQPSEFAKLGLILVMAHYLAANEGRLADLVGVVVPALVVAVPMVLLLLLEPDFGTTVITCWLVFVMLFVAGLSWRWVVALGGLGAVALGFIAILEPYRIERLKNLGDPFLDPEGGGYQVIQGWIALASGGWAGQGLAAGVAQRGGLPEPHTDFISAVVGEELGAVGWLAMVALYLVVVWRGFGIAARATDLFGALVATALTTLLASQAVINLGVVVGWMPAKGLVLPFLSYGASAVVAHGLAIALLLRVGLHAEEAS